MKDQWTDDTKKVTLCDFIGQYCEQCSYCNIYTDDEPCKSCVLIPTKFQREDKEDEHISS